ncbi:hypothetical protein Poly41_04950 [Novipirellula artificiosorum]|uniref:Uncharacterized protein n=1 Tax=Novipirellula artificiosorum TaxID=2528016 RepID=A0A5C6E4W5_9BACT|nr:hypothetical protein Poly41_04950 [Novipirellula artificiosorum]
MLLEIFTRTASFGSSLQVHYERPGGRFTEICPVNLGLSGKALAAHEVARSS